MAAGAGFRNQSAHDTCFGQERNAKDQENSQPAYEHQISRANSRPSAEIEGAIGRKNAQLNLRCARYPASADVRMLAETTSADDK